MSWSIGVVVNDVHISAECAKELFEAQDGDEIWYELRDVTHQGKVTFNPDHSEHMDWLNSNDALVAVLKKHRVKGDICFGSLEGDNDGSFWGYRFDGNGGMVPLKGRVVYEEQKQVFVGNVVVVTGTLAKMTRNEAHERIEDAGGEIATAVTKKTTLLVTGAEPGSKLRRARELGIRVIGQAEFYKLLGIASHDPDDR